MANTSISESFIQKHFITRYGRIVTISDTIKAQADMRRIGLSGLKNHFDEDEIDRMFWHVFGVHPLTVQEGV